MAPAARTRNPFFVLAALSSIAFVVTILAMIAAMLGDPAAPINRFLDQHGGVLIGAEVIAVLFTGWLALAIDRRQTLSAIRDPSAAASSSRAPGQDAES